MKKIISFLLAAIMIFTLAACRPKVPPVDENNGGNNTVGDNNIIEPDPKDEIVTVKLYFANQEYIMTGDESLDRIIAIEREIEPGDKSIEGVILEELKNEPEDEQLTTIVKKLEVLSVETVGDMVFVNLSGENLHGGSLEESLILQQIVLSLTELEGIEQVQILVDGSKRETLMGHILIEEPLKRADIK